MSSMIQTPRKRVVALFAAVLVTSVLAGCLHGGDDPEPDERWGPGGQDGRDDRRGPDDPENPTPPAGEGSSSGSNNTTQPRAAIVEAVLQVDPEEAWVGENFTFDGSASMVRHGSVLQWNYDFGDNESKNLSADEDPVVEHNYSAGGTYTVNLTLVVEGEDGRQVENSTNLTVFVHERLVIPETEVSAGLFSSDSEEHPFEAGTHALNFTVHLELEHTAMSFESSEGTVRVTDPESAAIVEQEFDLSSGETTDLSLEGEFNATGEHHVEIEVESGSVEYQGSLYVFYRVLG